MKSEKVSRAVNAHRLVDMDGDEVVETASRPRSESRLELRRLVQEAVDGAGVVLLLGSRQGVPTEIDYN